MPPPALASTMDGSKWSVSSSSDRMHRRVRRNRVRGFPHSLLSNGFFADVLCFVRSLALLLSLAFFCSLLLALSLLLKRTFHCSILSTPLPHTIHWPSFSSRSGCGRSNFPMFPSRISCVGSIVCTARTWRTVRASTHVTRGSCNRCTDPECAFRALSHARRSSVALSSSQILCIQRA